MFKSLAKILLLVFIIGSILRYCLSNIFGITGASALAAAVLWIFFTSWRHDEDSGYFAQMTDAIASGKGEWHALGARLQRTFTRTSKLQIAMFCAGAISLTTGIIQEQIRIDRDQKQEEARATARYVHNKEVEAMVRSRCGEELYVDPKFSEVAHVVQNYNNSVGLANNSADNLDDAIAERKQKYSACRDEVEKQNPFVYGTQATSLDENRVVQTAKNAADGANKQSEAAADAAAKAVEVPHEMDNQHVATQQVPDQQTDQANTAQVSNHVDTSQPVAQTMTNQQATSVYQQYKAASENTQPQTDTANCTTATDCAKAMLGFAKSENLAGAMQAASTIDSLTKPERGDKATARKLDQDGLAALKASNASDAVKLFAQAHDADPGDEEVISNLAYAYSADEQLAKSEDTAVLALSLNPRRTSVWAPLAVTLAKEGHPDQAVEAMWLAFQFSGDKQKTLSFIDTRLADERDPAVLKMYTESKAWLTENKKPKFN
ncbi:hypothetical protein [Paraburkholderia heleia]|uniref:hypothetical protein n=1 Tax=Paraburkholderia heleia TaxID=634127 RepID=UPI0031E1F7B5